MRSRLVADGSGSGGAARTFVVILDSGDETVSALTNFAKQQELDASHFVGLGAFSDVVIGFFDWQTKNYAPITIDEQVEVLSLVGDITVSSEGEPVVHAHVVVGKRDGSAHGGHLLKGHVRPTLEVTVVATAAHLRRVLDPESGIALIDPRR